MGVDYSSVGGIGIEVTKGMIEKFITAGLFTQENWDDDPGYPLRELKFPVKTAGSGNYTGEENVYYILVPGENLSEIIANEGMFRKKLAKFKIQLKQEDLLVISDLYMS